MRYNFNEIIDRQNTNCVKHDLKSVLFGSEDLIPMWVADMDFETPDFIVDAIKHRLNHPILAYSFRPKEFNNSIIQWLKNNHSWEVTNDELSFCPGVVSGIVAAIEALTMPGDEIIVQPPVYFPFFSSIEGSNRKLILNPLQCENNIYTIDFKDFEQKITSKTKALILCNPHNPVGRSWTFEELYEISEICEKHNLLILSDEIHSDLVFSPKKHIPIATVSEYAKQNTICFMAPSKTFNLAGLSTSFVVSHNEKLLKKYNISLETHHLNLGNIFGTVASIAAYQLGKEWLSVLKVYLLDNIELAFNFINTNIPKIKMHKPEATYLIWLDMRKLNFSEIELEEFCTKKAKIGFSYGKTFGTGGDGFVRMNIACPQSVLIQALNQLKDAVEAL